MVISPFLKVSLNKTVKLEAILCDVSAEVSDSTRSTKMASRRPVCTNKAPQALLGQYLRNSWRYQLDGHEEQPFEALRPEKNKRPNLSGFNWSSFYKRGPLRKFWENHSLSNSPVKRLQICFSYCSNAIFVMLLVLCTCRHVSIEIK